MWPMTTLPFVWLSVFIALVRQLPLYEELGPLVRSVVTFTRINGNAQTHIHSLTQQFYISVFTPKCAHGNGGKNGH